MSFEMKRSVTAAYTNKSIPKRPQKSWKNASRIDSAKKSLGGISTASTFYLPDRLQTISPQIPNRIKIRTKKTVQTILQQNSSDISNLKLSSTSWCLFDSKISKYLGFRQKYQREIASLTKIMTTYITIQFIQKYQINPQLYVKVTQQCTRMIGTSAQLKSKTWIKLIDLLYGAMLPSGNDAAFLLSQIIGYLHKQQRNNQKYLKNVKFLDISNQNTTLCIVQFVKMMNQKAQEIGMGLTKFSNPHGLQNAMNTSSPKDLIILSTYVSKNQLFRKVMNKQWYRYEYAQLIIQQNNKDNNNNIQNNISETMILKNQRKQKQQIKYTRRIWQNTNILLKKGWQGIKTGQTGAAGSCLSSLKNGIYIVVLNCKDNQARFYQTQRIYNWYVQKYRKQTGFMYERDKHV